MHGVTFRTLHREQVQSEFQCFFRHVAHHAHEVLAGVTVTDTAAGAVAQLVQGEIAAPVLGGVALTRVVNVHHGVERCIRSFHLDSGEVLLPEGGEFVESLVDVLQVAVLLDSLGSDLEALFLTELGAGTESLLGSDLASVDHESGNVVATVAFAVGKFLVGEAERSSPGTHFICTEEHAAVTVEATDLTVGGNVVHGEVTLHVSVLFEHDVAVLFPVALEGHGLRNPVGVRELLFSFEVAEFINRDNVHFLSATGDVRHLDVLEESVGARRDENRDLHAETESFGNPTHVGKTHVAFPLVQKIVT